MPKTPTDDRALGDDVEDTTTDDEQTGVQLAAAADDIPLDFAELIEHGSLVERVAHIYLDGKTYGDYEAALQELATLVDDDGNVVSEGDEALADGSRAQELAHRIHDLQGKLQASRRTVRFRAMPADEWPVFDREYRPNGQFKSAKAQRLHSTKIVAKCAIEPELTEEQVETLRERLTSSQFNALANAAFLACIAGGVDLPKSRVSLPAQKPPTSEQS